MLKTTNSGKTDPSVEKEEAVLPFEQFIQNFRTTLKRVFYEDNDIDRMGITRGVPPEVLGQIMTCNPLSVTIPTEYGGRGGVVEENLRILSAASYESLALSLTLGINNALFLQPFAKYGQDAVKPEVFSRFMHQQNMGGLMITEPDFGSDALNMQTAYTETEHHYHLRGTKHWAGLTGQADFWLLTARRKTDKGSLQRDVDFFVCDNTTVNQRIVVDEKFENLGLYQIPYGRNVLDVKVPKTQRLIPHTNGVQLMLDLLHRSRLQFPGMGLGFVKRMLDEAIEHCRQRLVTGKSLFSYDQVQSHLSRLQANFTVLSAFSRFGANVAGIENDLTGRGLEANVIKTVTTDMMQESSQTLLTLVGAKGYKLNHIAGRGTVDSRPFQIFEGANDILYNQIGDSVLKSMRAAKETNLYRYLCGHSFAERAVQLTAEWVSFDVDMTLSQRKVVELGKLLSRVFSLNFVLDMENTSFRADLIGNAVDVLRTEIATLFGSYSRQTATAVVQDYEDNSSWYRL